MNNLDGEVRDSTIKPLPPPRKNGRRAFDSDRKRFSDSSAADLLVRRTNPWSWRRGNNWVFTRTRGDEHDPDCDCNWSGMALEAEERWRNALTGRFGVKRKNFIAKDPSKLPHQRILSRPKSGGRPVFTIHKHSRASAFSINRQHRIKNKDVKRTRFIIFLGKRSAQSLYASTLSTRELKTQGQLDYPRRSDQEEEDVVTSQESSICDSVDLSTLANGSGPDASVLPGSSSKLVAPLEFTYESDSTVRPPKAVVQIDGELEAEEEHDERSPPVRTPHGTYEPTLPGGLEKILSSKPGRLNSSLMEFDDAFYMLLPLWPGSTDDASALKHPFVVPDIPFKKRQYLLVFYKPLKSTEKGKRHDRKKDSPTPSRGSVKDSRSLILTSFYIGARIVLHEELPGSGLRIPEEGLPVTGPLKEAYDSMPSLHELKKEVGLKDSGVVIGFCSSRDGGIQFEKHRFLELGLCTATERDMSSKRIITPTPIGLAVLETIWAGGIALTSFGPAS